MDFGPTVDLVIDRLMAEEQRHADGLTVAGRAAQLLRVDDELAALFLVVNARACDGDPAESFMRGMEFGRHLGLLEADPISELQLERASEFYERSRSLHQRVALLMDDTDLEAIKQLGRETVELAELGTEAGIPIPPIVEALRATLESMGG